jgi:serine/threonine protein kinase
VTSVDEIQPVPFGNFLLLERLAMGGMAEVFLARNTRDDRLCAVKRILPAVAADDEFIAMFIDEAKIAGHLSHPNIAQIVEIGKIDGSYFIAMEYVSGHDARAVWDRVRETAHETGAAVRGLPLGLACFAVRKLAEGLDYAHRRKDGRGRPLGIIHRDVSPQNLLISYEGDLKIIDFGIAKAANRLVKTQTGILKGKFAYMAPEQARGEPIDHRSDVFAIGVVLYELLTGERAFKGDTDFALLEKVRRVDVTPVRQLRPEVPRELERIVMKAMGRDAGDRYAWASVLADDLDRFLADSAITTSRDDLGAFVRRVFRDEHAEEQRRLQLLRRRGAAPPGSVAAEMSVAASGATVVRGAAPARNGRPPAHDEHGTDSSTTAGDALSAHSIDGDTAVLPVPDGLVDPSVVSAPDPPRRKGRGSDAVVDKGDPRASERSSDRASRSEARRGRPGRVSAEGRAVELPAEAAATAAVLPASSSATAFEAAESLVWTGARPGAALPPVMKLKPRATPSSVDAPPPLEPTQLPQPVAAASTTGLVVAGLVGALLGAGLAFAVALAVRARPPDTLVVTQPRQTEVRRGDVVLCAQTPCAVHLGKGTHTLRLKAPGVAAVDRVVDVGAVAAIVDVALDEPERIVQVETNPPGATVMLDDKPLDGATPLALAPMPAERTVRLRLARDGFEPLFITREVGAGGTWRFDLPSSTTAWVVKTVPADASILGPLRESTGTVSVTVGRKPVTLRVQRPGCEASTTTLTATGVANVERTVELVCPPLVGKISIQAPRRPAVVRIDGVTLGKAVSLDDYPMPAGTWDVAIITPRGRRELRTLAVRDGETAVFASKAK